MVEDAGGHLCLRQRPSTGLLAGLWEFPSLPRAPGNSQEQLWQQLLAELTLLPKVGEEPIFERTYVGKVHMCVRIYIYI